MAKEKYIIQAELDTKGVLKNARDAQREINNIGRLAKETNKNAQITGSVTMKEKGIKETQRALRLAKQNVDNLTKALANAKMSGATQKQVQALESQLVKAQTQATRLSSELAKVGTQTPKNGGFGSVVDKMKGAGSALLGTFSKVGNIVSGVSAGFGILTSSMSKATGLAGNFANRLMDTYDAQIQAQKTLSTTLSDGARGYEKFNSYIDKGNLLLKSQRNDLNELGATISGYTKLTGDQAFKIVNSINAIGDSLGLSMDTQKQFSYGLAQALGSGTLHAQDFNQIMQSALGAQFRDVLIQAANELQNVGIKASELPKALEEGKISADLLANTLGDTWATKMAKSQSALKGIEVSAGGVKRALKEGTLTVEDFTRVFGEDFNSKIVNAMNSTKSGTVTMENFKGAMEDGVFNTQVMNRALELFQQKGDQLVSAGPSTWGQIREMVRSAFNTNALDGFRQGLGDVGLSTADLGNKVTEMSGIVGQKLGQMAGQAVGALTRIIDKNGDGKVSEEEFSGAVDDAVGAVKDFFNKVNNSSFMGFIRGIGQAIDKVSEFIGWVQKAYGFVDGLLDKVRGLGGGLVGRIGGVGSIFSKGWSIWGFNQLVDPMGFKENTALSQKLMGSRAGHIPLDLQFFAGGREAINKAIEATQPYTKGINGVSSQPSIGTQDNSTQDIKIYVQSTADGQRIAKEIYNKLERNGVRLDKR